MLKRKDDWAMRFTMFLSSSLREGVVLDWEYFNCASWSADCIEELTGVDIYEEFRGASDSKASAIKMVADAGFDSLSDVVASKLPRCDFADVRRGDIVLAPPAQETDSAAHSFGRLNMAVCVADPPYYWNLTEEGLARGLIMDSMTFYKVGDV